MSDDVPRLLDDPSLPPELRDALRHAVEIEPDPLLVEELSAKILPQLGATPSPAITSARSVSALTKLIAAAVLVAGGAWWGLREAPPGPMQAQLPTPVPMPAPVPVIERPPAVEATAPVPPPPPSQPTPARPSRPLARPLAPPPAKVERKAPAASPRDPERELALIRAVRAAFERARDPEESLRLAAQHKDEFPEGAWWQERETYATLALVASGRRDEAKARAETLFRAAPHTQHRARIEAALEEGQPQQ